MLAKEITAPSSLGVYAISSKCALDPEGIGVALVVLMLLMVIPLQFLLMYLAELPF